MNYKKEILKQVYDLIKSINPDDFRLTIHDFGDNDLSYYFPVEYPKEKKIEIDINCIEITIWLWLNDNRQISYVHPLSFSLIRMKIFWLIWRIYQQKLKERKERIKKNQQKFIKDFINYESK